MTRLQLNLDATARARAEQVRKEREVATQALTRRALWRGILWGLIFQALVVLAVWAAIWISTLLSPRGASPR